AEFAGFGEDLRGTSAPIRATYRQLVGVTQAMVATARSIAEERKNIMADDSRPLEHRNRLVAERTQDADVLIDKLHEAAKAAANKTRIGLMDAIKPQPVRDAGQRQLHRQELDVVLRGQSDKQMHDRMLDIVRTGKPEWIGE